MTFLVRFRRLLLALGFATLLAATTAQAAPAPLTVIPLEPYGGDHMALRVRAGDREGLFLIDTAGGVSSVSPDFAAAIGCKPWGQITGFRMRGDRLDLPRCDDAKLEIGGRTFGVPIAGVFDFSRMTPPGAPRLDGVVALDAFARHAVTLDLAGRKLIMESPASLKARLAGAAQVPVRYARDAAGLSRTAFIGVEGAGGRLWMEVDSGSDAAILVGKHAAPALGLDPALTKGQPATLQVASGPRTQRTARVLDIIYDGNIGIPTLKDWVVTFDVAGERLAIAPAR